MIHTHYDNLKVSRTAPLEVIKAAYKSLAQKYHPDRNQGDSEAARIMKLLNEAYEVLSDPIKRAKYDEWLGQQEKMQNSFSSNKKDAFQKETNIKNSVNELPDDIKGWSWGAFLLAPVWLVAHRWWFGLLAWIFIPLSGIFIGFKAREWAWKNNKWDNIEHFNRVQKKWSFWGGGIFCSIFVIGILAAIAIPAYQNKAIRNQVITELGGISLGMRPVDVTLAKGKASNSSEKPKIGENGASLYWYFDYSNSSTDNYWLTVDFDGQDINSLEAGRICSNRPDRLNIKGISYLEYTGEKEIIRKLGKPTNISISKDGTSKFISYIPNNIAFEFTRDKITMVCISEYEVAYAEEYQDKAKVSNAMDTINNESYISDENKNSSMAYPVNENINNSITYPTSFDCSKARSIPENLICNNAELAAADLELAKSVEQARIMVADKKAFTQRLRKQWNYREKNCVNTECLSTWFIYMNNELNKIIKTGEVYTEIPTIAPETKLNSTETSSNISSAQLSYSEKSAIELACITEKSNGAASYNRCLVAQMEELKHAPRQPNLDRFTSSEKSAIELACITEKSNGAASYNRCLVKQIQELQNAPSAPF